MAEITLQLSNPSVGYALISLCEYVVCLSPACGSWPITTLRMGSRGLCSGKYADSMLFFCSEVTWTVWKPHLILPRVGSQGGLQLRNERGFWLNPRPILRDSCLNSAVIHLNGNSAGQYWRHRFFQKNGPVNAWCGIHARQARRGLAPSAVVWTYPYRTSFKLVI